MRLVVSNDNGGRQTPPPPPPAPVVRQRPYQLIGVPNLGIPARRVLITEAKMAATNVWFAIHMADLP